MIADAPLVLTGQSNGAIRACWRRSRPCFSTSSRLMWRKLDDFIAFVFLGGPDGGERKTLGGEREKRVVVDFSEAVRSRQRASQSDFKVAAGRGEDPEPSLQLTATGHSCLRVRPRPLHSAPGRPCAPAETPPARRASQVAACSVNFRGLSRIISLHSISYLTVQLVILTQESK